MDDVGAVSQRTSRAPLKRKPRKLDSEKVLTLARAGMSDGDIAKHQGVQRTTVWRFLEAHRAEISSINIYKSHRADLLAGLQGDCLDLQKRIVASIDDGVLAALKPSEKTGLLMALNATHGTIYDKERLERGQSTANVGLVAKIMAPALSAAFSGPQAVDNAQGQTPSLGVSPSAEPSHPVSSENSGQEEAGVRGEASS